MEQAQDQDNRRGERPTVEPALLPSDNYVSVQILQGIPNVLASGLIYISLMIFVVGLIYASVTRIDVTVRCPGVIQPEQVRRVYAHEPGSVNQVLAAPGQLMRKGQSLMVLHRNADGDRSSVQPILADADGMVLEMPFRDCGQPVQEGDLLFTLQPEGTRLKVDLQVPNKDAGLIATGMSVGLALDAFPVADFGVVRAHVSNVSPMARKDPQSGYVYPVSALLVQAFVEAHGTRFPIRPGMVATAEIVVAQRRMLSALIQGIRD